MTEYPDLGAWALARLQNASAITDLVMPGMILEAGALRAPDINAAQDARLRSNETARVLAVVVVDTGEENLTATCSVIIYDRYGYTNIRAVREAVIAALVNCPAALPRDAHVSQVRYAGRSGHGFALDPKVDMDYERVDFAGQIYTEQDIYL